MDNIRQLQKQREKISDLYPLVQANIVPPVYESQIISYRAKEINEYNIGLWHRFFVKFYGQPTEINSFLCKAKDHEIVLDENSEFQTVCAATFRNLGDRKINFLNLSAEDSQKYADGLLTIEPHLLDWKYFFELPSKNIIAIGSKETHTRIFISLVDPDSSKIEKINKEAKKFISAILEDIKKHSDNLFNPKKKFKDKKVFCYTLWNVYLSNYLSAEHIIKISDQEEKKLAKNLDKFSDKSIMLDKNASIHTQSSILVCGLFYSSAISYLFMALEGFINIIFHRFVKHDIDDLPMEKELHIEQKIRLMPYLCDCFDNDFNEKNSEIYKDFKKLKQFRNTLFHSKVEDSLFTLMDWYGGFYYNYKMDEYKNDFLPSYKWKLTNSDVIQVKETVDKMIENIINAMNPTAQEYVKKHILSGCAVPFISSSEGADLLLKSKNDENSIP